VNVGTQLVVIGGFPGTGKRAVAAMLADDLGVPLLASDLVSDTMKAVLSDIRPLHYPVRWRPARATRRFRPRRGVRAPRQLCRDGHQSGLAISWEALDAISVRHRDVRVLSFILECSPETWLNRLQQRHLDDPERYPSADDFMRQPQRAAVGRLLAKVDRPDAHRVNAERSVGNITEDVRETAAAAIKRAQ
jgi:hypothetical protein